VDIALATGIIASQIGYMFGQNSLAKVLYGGSVDDDNAADILSIDGIDGLLVGGASLDVQKFAKIVETARAGVSSS
jgi:triosephosphate isomerase